MSFFKFPRNILREVCPGLFCKVITGKNMQMCYILLHPGMAVDHTHTQEQMGYIISGQVKLTIGDESKTCGPGDVYHIPPNVPHSFRVPGNTEVEFVEIFSPVKEEYREESK